MADSAPPVPQDHHTLLRTIQHDVQSHTQLSTMIRGTFTNSGCANNQSLHSVKAFVLYEFLLQTEQAELLRQYCIYPLMQLPMNDLVIESCSRPPEISADALSPDANLPWERLWFDRIDDDDDVYELDDDSNHRFNNE
jgi:hypothetical protein